MDRLYCHEIIFIKLIWWFWQNWNMDIQIEIIPIKKIEQNLNLIK